MGKKIVVGTSIMRVIDNKTLPNAIVTGAIKSDINKGEPSDYIIQELVNSIGMRADMAYRMGKSGKYIHGLPEANIRDNQKGATEISNLLTQAHGLPVTMHYSRLGSPNLLHLGWVHLISAYGYSSSNNTLSVLTNQRGRPVYLVDMQAVIPKASFSEYKPGVLDVWGIPPNAGITPATVNPATEEDGYGGYVPSVVNQNVIQGTPVLLSDIATSAHLKVTTIEVVEQKGMIDGVFYLKGQTITKSFTFPVPTVSDENADYFQAQYSVNGNMDFWMYQKGIGLFPQLDSIDTSGTTASVDLFPFIYWRYNKVSEITDKETETYKSTKKLVEKLGIDYDKIGESIDENPDIKDVIQAFMMFGVPPDTTNELEAEYLFKFFDNMYLVGGNDYRGGPINQDLNNKINRTSAISDGRNKFVLNIEDKRFRMVFSATGISKKSRGGNIGPVNTYKCETGKQEYTIQVMDDNQGLVDAKREYPFYTYKHQITEGIYTEITVYELEMQYFVYGTKYTTSDNIKNILLVPLDRSITKSLSLPVKEQLYSRSLHFVFNSMQVIKTKWYQSGLFAVVVFIVGIVIAIWFPPATAAIMAAELGVSMVTLAIMSAVMTQVLGMVLGQVVTLVAEVIGGKLGLILAAVAFVLAVYYGVKSGQYLNSTWAKNLMMAASNLMQGSMQTLMEDLREGYKSFQEQMDKDMQLLEDAQALLDNSNHMSPFFLVGEKPEDFYNRTIHSGNIGVVCFDDIHSYVDNSLRLPTINDTVGDTFYGIYN